MSDNLQRFLPDYDDEAERLKLSAFSKDDLLDMLVRSYKEKRVWTMYLDEQFKKLERIGEIVAEPSSLARMPGIPNATDLKRMVEDDDNKK
jgi:hypothetical protein